MDAILEKRLARLKNYRTRYELVIDGPKGKFLVFYISRRNRAGLLIGLRERAGDGSLGIIVDPNLPLHFGKLARDGATLGEYRVYFSGRTQREAYLGGELVFLPDAK